MCGFVPHGGNFQSLAGRGLHVALPASNGHGDLTYSDGASEAESVQVSAGQMA